MVWKGSHAHILLRMIVTTSACTQCVSTHIHFPVWPQHRLLFPQSFSIGCLWPHLFHPGIEPERDGAHMGKEEQKKGRWSRQLGANGRGTGALREGEKISPSLGIFRNRPAFVRLVDPRSRTFPKTCIVS